MSGTVLIKSQELGNQTATSCCPPSSGTGGPCRPGGSQCHLAVLNAAQVCTATARPSHKAGSRPVQTETWRSGLTHPLAKRATPSRGSAGSNPAVSALEGDPAWRGNGLENRQVRKGRGSIPPPSATVTMAAVPRHYRPPRGALLSLRQTRGVPRRRAASVCSGGAVQLRQGGRHGTRQTHLPQAWMPTRRRRPLLPPTQPGIRSQTRHINSTRLRPSTPRTTRSLGTARITRPRHMLAMRATHRGRRAVGSRPRRPRPHNHTRTRTRDLQPISSRTIRAHLTPGGAPEAPKKRTPPVRSARCGLRRWPHPNRHKEGSSPS